MKKLFSLILAIAIAVSAFANDIVKNMDEFVKDHRDRMYISYVYVSKAMMDMVDSRNTLSQINGINGNVLIGKLSSIQIIKMHNDPMSKRTLQSAITNEIDLDFEKLLRIEDYSESTEIYFRKAEKTKNGNQPAAIVMITESGRSYKVIIFTGTFTLDDVVKTMEKRRR